MKVNLSQAVKVFFGNSSLEMVYFEAIANAIDADATEITISINLDIRSKSENLSISIEDNGIGFTDDRYRKFSNLFDVEEASHKGLGRLVYIAYFQEIEVKSYFGNNKKREFTFSDNFNEGEQNIEQSKEHVSGTTITMKNYALQKLAKNDYIDPIYLKQRILEEFYSLLFKKKENDTPVTININANIEGQDIDSLLNASDILELEKVDIDTPIDTINILHLYYAIKKDSQNEKSLISAISIDNRTLKYDIIANEYIPIGYNMVFLLVSDYFIGKVDLSRQNIKFPPNDEKRVKELFRAKVSELIELNIDTIAQRNKGLKEDLIDRYPHLGSYFNNNDIGFVSRDEILKQAQNKFFKDQRELLDATALDDVQFDKALDISSKALTEYILFREVTIKNLRKINSDNSEAELHKLFATQYNRFDQDDKVKDVYRNNAWVLDDKYMTYKTILSDRDMDELVNIITKGEVEKDSNKPDIALVFSKDPKEDTPVDVVIVELKKRGISLEENMKVVTQLEKRARNLMKYYNNQIQRIWFYGIIELNEEVELALAGEYTELYSSGKMYYKETEVAISLNPKKSLPIGVFIWDIDAVIDDAEARNSTFLELIKSKFE